MKRFKKSLLAWCALIHTVAFFSLYFLLPENIFKYLGYALVLGTSAAALLRWHQDAWFNFREGRSGANFLVVGTFALIFGVFIHRVVVVGSSTFPNLWLFEDDVLIRASVWYLGGALAVLLLAPDIEEGKAPPRSIFALLCGIGLGSFLMGFSVALGVSHENISPLSSESDNPVCPENRSIVGSQNKIYHPPDSKYLGMVKPFKCFKSIDEAKRKGFHPPLQ